MFQNFTWSVFTGNNIFESVDNDRHDREGEGEDPREQRVDRELLPLRSRAQTKLGCCKLKKNTDDVMKFCLILFPAFAD